MVSTDRPGSSWIFGKLEKLAASTASHGIMRANKIRALHGYRTRRYVAAKPSAVVPDLVKRNLDVIRPNKGLGHGYHIHSHLAGLARGRDGSLLKTDRRLVNGADPSTGACSGCCADGRAPSPHRNGDPFRSRLSIWQRRLAAVLPDQSP
jgi:hypothetical protein